MKGLTAVKKIDATVRRETMYVACWVVLLSVLMQAVFLIIGKWELKVLFGNLLGGAATVLNFLLMGISVQNALGKEEKQASSLMKLSQALRNLMLFCVAVIGLTVNVFSPWSTIIPLFFARIAVSFRQLFEKDDSGSLS